MVVILVNIRFQNVLEFLLVRLVCGQEPATAEIGRNAETVDLCDISPVPFSPLPVRRQIARATQTPASSGQHLFDDMSVDIGQSPLDTVVVKRQSLVINSQ